MDSTAPAHTPDSPSKKRVFFTRLVSTVLLWSLMAAAFVAGQDWVFVTLAAGFGIAGGAEYFRLMRADGGAREFRALGLVVCAAYWAASSWWVLVRHAPQPMWMDVAAVAVVVQGAFLLTLRRPLEGPLSLQRIFGSVTGVVYTAVLFGFALRIMYFKHGHQPPGGVFLMLYLVVVTKFCDAGAYAFGVLFGRHKMIPHISPAKSWEGLVGAFVGGIVTAALMLACFSDRLHPLGWMSGLLVAPALCSVGVVGDLAESVLKRCFIIKDSGHALPGIGGVLDLTDSLIFTAPVFYLCLVALS
ncbi:MAG: phosphatidate cytidylyltransferase [Verrucomicrobiaceae bacterium]|nr:phosphatidate cytidylyltransferase [Verrucomicrobiaceae bacterium]